MPVFKFNNTKLYIMTTTKRIYGALLLGIMAMVSIALLTSFIKSDGKNKASAKKTKQAGKSAVIKPYEIFFWNGTSWQNEPYAICDGNGAICSAGFSSMGSPRTVPDILTEAVNLYRFAGYLSNPSINWANIQVGKNYSGDPVKITVNIQERIPGAGDQ